MRIGMILDKEFPTDPRVEREATTLSEAGHEVILFNVSFGSNRDLGIFDYSNFKVYHVNVPKFVFKWSALIFKVPVYNYFILAKIRQFIDEVKPDILHVHDMVISWPTLKLAKELNLKTVVDLHENRPVIMREYGGFKNPIKRWLIGLKKWDFFQNEIIKQADEVIVVTELAKKAISVDIKNPEAIHVVPNTLNPEDVLNSPLDQQITDRFKGKFNLFYFGDTGLRRGTDLIIYSLPRLVKIIPNIHLIMVGNSSEDVKLRKLAKKLKVASYISFEGYQGIQKFRSYGAAADVCLSPLTRNKHHDTTYANKLFQYMAIEKAQVVSNCTAQKDLMEKSGAGLVFNARSTKEFIDCVERLFLYPSLAKELGQNGRAYLEKYNWKNQSENLLEIYSDRTSK